MSLLDARRRRWVGAGVAAVLAASSVVAGAVPASADITWESVPGSHTFSVTEANITYFTSANVGGQVLMVDRIIDETGRALLCADFSKPSPNGQSLSPLGKASPQLAFLANRLADPGSDGNLAGLNERQTYYVLQYVAHMYDSGQFASFTDDLGGPVNDPDGLIPRIQAIKAEADAATDQNFIDTHTVSVDQGAPASSITDEGMWVSDPVTVSADSAGASVTLTASVDEASAAVGAEVIDAESGEPVTTVTPGEQIQIQAADSELKGVATTLTANITANWEGGHERVGYMYGGDPAVQSIVGFDELTFNDTQSTSFSTSTPEVVGSLSGVKAGDDSAFTLLPDVEFTLEDEAGNVIQTTTTDKNGAFGFEDVPWGTWYVHETKAAGGYVLADGRARVTVDGNHTVISLGTVTNSLASGTILVHKQDQSGAALSGAEFTLTDEDGNAEKVVTGADGLAQFTIRANHVYSLVESDVPDGYSGGFSESNITLDHDGQVLEYTAVNTKEDSGMGDAGQGLASVNTGEPSNSAAGWIALGVILAAVGGGAGIATRKRQLAHAAK